MIIAVAGTPCILGQYSTVHASSSSGVLPRIPLYSPYSQSGLLAPIQALPLPVLPRPGISRGLAPRAGASSDGLPDCVARLVSIVGIDEADEKASALLALAV